MILEQKIEHKYVEIDKPEYLSCSLSKYWNEDIKDTRLIRISLQILRDIRLPDSSKKKSHEFYCRIENKLSYICKMLKYCVRRYSSADPIDREIYRFTRMIELAIKGSYFWTADMACTALMLFIQDTKYALRVASDGYRKYGMEQYVRNYVLLWKDYLKDQIMLEWQASNVINMNANIFLDEITLGKIKDTEGIQILTISCLREKYSSFDIHAKNDTEDTHLFLYEYYSRYIWDKKENNDVLMGDAVKIVMKVEPILQKRAHELIAMSKKYREYLKIPGAPKDPFAAFSPDSEEKNMTEPQPSEIEKEAANMTMGDLMRSVMGEDRTNIILNKTLD